MKKIIIIAFAVLTTGLVSSCTKDNSVKPAAATVKTGDAMSGTGSADGTPPQ
jgi:outer membrane lipoprotein-sorting protein